MSTATTRKITGLLYDKGGAHFNVKHPDFGTKGDARVVTDGAITSGTPNFTSATAAFTSSDQGKAIVVSGAGASGVPLVTTVLTYVSATAVTLSANAGTTVSGATSTVGTDDRAALQNVLSEASAAGHGTVVVPAGRYHCTLTGDSHSILIPSNCNIVCEEGAIFQWSYWGSPLFCAVNKDNILFKGPTFEWCGILSDIVTSNVNRFGWTGTLADRDMCAHLLSLGSNNVRLTDGKCRTLGDNPTLATQAFWCLANFFPKQDNVTRTRNNAVENFEIDDVVVGTLHSAQDGLRFRNITSRRFPGNHPIGGGSGINGHLIYQSENGGATRSRGTLVENITDHGGFFGTITSRQDTSIQVKCSEGTIIRGVMSKRPTGVLSVFEFVNGLVDDVVWQPATVQSNGMGSGTTNGVGVIKSIFKGLNFVLPDNTDIAAFNMTAMSECATFEATISASHTSIAVPSAVLTNSSDNRLRIDYLARNATTANAIQFITTAHRNQVDINPIGQNQQIRPFNNTGCLDNIVRIRDNIIGKWSNASQWSTEANSPAIGYEPIRKTMVYRIGTTTNPTTTFQLPRDGIYRVSCTLIESTGAHLRGGDYLVIYDSGALQTVQLMGAAWTKGASAPTVMTLAVSSAGVVTVTSTAGSFAWDIMYDISSAGNLRYADY